MRQPDATDISAAPVVSASVMPPAEPILFPVSTTKFIVMHLATFGLYNVFWTYKSWNYYKNTGISPGFRTWLAIWFEYSLLKEIVKTGESFGVARKFSPPLVFALWLATGLTGRLPCPFFLICVLCFVPLIPVIIYINEINRTAGRSDAINGKFTPLNWLAIVVGGWLLIGIVAG
jgi:hypothetical protein